MLLEITLSDTMSMLLVAAALLLAFKILETNWSYRISKPYSWDLALKNKQVSRKLRSIERRTRDKVRFYSIWFQISRIQQLDVPGAFAELGVYRGATAAIIHETAPDRILHLFDTFDGFDDRDIQADTINEENRSVDFSGTGVDIVRQLIGGNDNIIFHKGYFPDTVLKAEERFAFVNIDADLYLPTMAALRYFYPRVSPGGVIMIHDYNHTWPGVKKATDEFLCDIQESLVMLPDWQGTAVLTKNFTPASGRQPD